MTAESHHPSYLTIWIWLVMLLLVGLVVFLLPIGKAMAIFLIFAVAAVKAFLVARYYMHLKSETVLVLAIAGLPVLLLIGMALTLVPDIVFNH